MIPVLPRCDLCGVEYVEGYEGPCQEPLRGWPHVCPGTVSYRATAEALASSAKPQQNGGER